VTQQINLFNPIFLRQKKYFSTATILQALALVLVGALSFYAYAAYQTNRLSREVADAGQRLESEKKRLEAASGDLGPRQKSKELEQQSKELERQVRDREEILGIQSSSLTGGSRGFSEYLKAFARQSVNGLWLTNFSLREGGAKLSLGGRTLRPDLVPDYLKRLGKEKVMQGQSFSSLDMQFSKVVSVSKEKTQDGYFEFSLRSGDGDLSRDEAGKAR